MIKNHTTHNEISLHVLCHTYDHITQATKQIYHPTLITHILKNTYTHDISAYAKIKPFQLQKSFNMKYFTKPSCE